MAVEYDPKSNLFQVNYQSPFGGIDTTAYASAIDPHNFAAMTTAINNANKLQPIAWKQVMSLSQSSSASFLGYIPVADSGTVGYIITTNSVVIVASDGAGGLTYTTVTPYSPSVATYGYFSYVVIDNLLIWTSETWNEIWSFNTTTNVISRLTNYVGGGKLGALDNQLINLGGISTLDGYVPYRISWSAPGEYGVFQPYDVTSGTGSYDAGFNDLPDTSDVLQGIITIGTVAYLFRSQGITQMNPTGQGIDPFAFNHLWASELGIGTVLPDTISQYGPNGFFIADSGIYSLGLAGVSDITGPAKELLFGLINNLPNLTTLSALPLGAITGRCVPYLGTHPSVFYVLGISNAVTGTSGSVTNPSIASYALYGIDSIRSSSCYDLGTLNVATDPTIAATNAVGKLSFINRSYVAAPVPVPPVPPIPTPTSVTTTYGATSPNIYFDPAFYEINGSQIRTLGSVGGGVATPFVIMTNLGFSLPPTVTIDGITGILNWVGQSAGSGILEQVALYYHGAQIGTIKTPGTPNTTSPTSNSYGSTTDLWGYALTPAIINDPTFGIGFQVTTQATGSTRSFFDYFTLSVEYNVPGGLPTYTPTALNVAQIVPLFVAINNGVLPAAVSTFTAQQLVQPLYTSTGTIAFRKEQFKFAYVPTVSKIGFIAAKIDNSQAASISVSIDGGAHFGTWTGPSGETLGYPDITTFPGIVPQATNDPFSTVFTDGVVSIERPQLVIKITNILIAEVWYQGTLADFPVI